MTIVIPRDTRIHRPPFNPHVERFLAYLIEERGLQANSAKIYGYSVRYLLEKFGLEDPAELHLPHVHEWLASLPAGRDSRYKRKYLDVLTHVERYKLATGFQPVPAVPETHYQHPQDLDHERSLNREVGHERRMLAFVGEVAQCTKHYSVLREELRGKLVSDPAFHRHALKWAHAQTDDDPWPEVAAADLILALDARLANAQSDSSLIPHD